MFVDTTVTYIWQKKNIQTLMIETCKIKNELNPEFLNK